MKDFTPLLFIFVNIFILALIVIYAFFGSGQIFTALIISVGLTYLFLGRTFLRFMKAREALD
jgi:hypothetical protein